MKRVTNNLSHWIYISLSIAATFAFFLLADYIFTTDLTQIQTQIYDYMLKIQNPHLSKFLFFFTKTSNPVPVLIGTLIICLLLFLKRYRMEALLVLLTILTLTFSNVLLKNWFSRERPPFEHLIQETGYSFPSGHSMMSFGIAILICYLAFHLSSSTPLSIILTLIGFLYSFSIGFSRIYVSVHYLSDVIGGYLAAISVTCLLIAIYELLIKYSLLPKKRGNR